MNLRQYLRENRLYATIVLLAIAAPASWMLRSWVVGAPPTNEFVGPPIADYVLYNATVWSYDPQGLLGFTMTAPRMDRRGGDDSLYINAPVFEITSKKPGVPNWQGNAPFGWVNKAGTEMRLNGAVWMCRPAYAQGPMATLRTSNVTGWPKENRMETAEPATLTQGQSEMNGIGMRASLNDNHLELLHDVHGFLYPRQKNATTQPAGHGAAAPATCAGTTG